MATATAAFGLVAFLAMGLQGGGLGVAWPDLRADFDRPVSALGQLLGAGTLGFLLAALGNRRTLPTLGVGRQVVLGGAAVAAGLGLMATAPSWALVLVGSALSGLGAGAFEAALNTHLSVTEEHRLLNLVHGAFGIGATVGPLAVATALGGGAAWRAGLGALAVVWAIVALGLVLTRSGWSAPVTPTVGAVPVVTPSDVAPPPPSSAAEPAAPAGGAADGSASAVRPARRRAVVAAVAASFAVYTSVEMATGYLSLPLLEHRGLDEGSASRWIAAYWGALTLGRILLGARRVPVPPGRLVTGATLLALVGLGLLAGGPEDVAPAGLVVAGFGLAGIFPALVALVPGRVGRAAAPGVVGIGMAAASAGVALGPAVVARVAERWGDAAIAPALVLAGLALLATHGLATAVARARPAPTAPSVQPDTRRVASTDVTGATPAADTTSLTSPSRGGRARDDAKVPIDRP